MASKPATKPKPKAKAGNAKQNVRRATTSAEQDQDWVQFTTRLSSAYAEKLRKACLRDERPAMQYIRRVLEQHLDSRPKGK